MKKTTNAPKVPTASIAVNKSRLKVYNKKGSMPTYYLTKGQEFQIELFNPTTDVVLAKISLNNNSISQGGLILNPGQRVFLDRYIDVAKKFLFDTYEVANTEEVKAAIEDNGDFKVQFFREELPIVTPHPFFITNDNVYNRPIGLFDDTTGTTGGWVNESNTTGTLRANSATTNIGATSVNYNDTSFTTTSMNADTTVTLDAIDFTSEPLKKKTRKRKSKSIETGRVEQGSHSSQKLVEVSKTFSSWAFHTIECKMLPLSQKVNTIKDVIIKRYCTSCGGKLKKTNRFCGNCGTKA